MAQYTYKWELTANNFYQRKSVPIIWFIFQFGFLIVWDADLSGLSTLKCSSLIVTLPLTECSTEKSEQNNTQWAFRIVIYCFAFKLPPEGPVRVNQPVGFPIPN